MILTVIRAIKNIDSHFTMTIFLLAPAKDVIMAVGGDPLHRQTRSGVLSEDDLDDQIFDKPAQKSCYSRYQ